MDCPISDIDGLVIGGHSDTGMIPLTRLATRNSLRVSNFLDDQKLQKIMEDTKVGGATLTKMLGTSAWYAPGAAVSSIVQSIACDQKKVFPCSTFLTGEYNLDDICIGVPVVIGSQGIQEIIEIKLNESEKKDLEQSAAGVRSTNSLLDRIDC